MAAEPQSPSARNYRPMKFKDLSFSLKAFVAELFAMSLFVYLGCATASFMSTSSAVGGASVYETAVTTLPEDSKLSEYLAALQLAGSWGVTVALTFGLGIAVLVYCTAHVSGGQLNPVVTTCLFLTGNLGSVQAIANIVAQYLGAILGAAFLYGTTPNASNATLGSNSVSASFTNGQATMGEIVMTCLLVFTVLQTCCERRSVAKNMAPLAIGLSVVLGHFVMLPVDGCSINPARSFGPAALSGTWGNFWVFNVGPWVGGLFGVLCHLAMWLDWDTKINAMGKKLTHVSNTVSNDNNGLSDSALRN
jgi:MIP family channel proteins